MILTTVTEVKQWLDHLEDDCPLVVELWSPLDIHTAHECWTGEEDGPRLSWEVINKTLEVFARLLRRSTADNRDTLTGALATVLEEKAHHTLGVEDKS